MANNSTSASGAKLRLTPIISAVFSLAGAVLYFAVPTYIQSTKLQEFIFAGIALGCAAVGLLVFLIVNVATIKHGFTWQKIAGHALTLFMELFILIPNIVKLCRAFRLDFVPVMHTNTLGVWMLVFAGLLIVGAILHPRKATN